MRGYAINSHIQLWTWELPEWQAWQDLPMGVIAAGMLWGSQQISGRINVLYCKSGQDWGIKRPQEWTYYSDCVKWTCINCLYDLQIRKALRPHQRCVLVQWMVGNAETYKWSMCREKLSMGCLVTNGMEIYISHPGTQITEETEILLRARGQGEPQQNSTSCTGQVLYSWT